MARRRPSPRSALLWGLALGVVLVVALKSVVFLVVASLRLLLVVVVVTVVWLALARRRGER